MLEENGLHDRCRRQDDSRESARKAYIYKDQPSRPISVSNCIYETYDLGETLILGGGFRAFAGPPAVSDGRHNRIQNRCIMYYSFICTLGLKY
jgi:hypothetical protein